MQAATNQYHDHHGDPLELLYAILPMMGVMMFIERLW